MSPVDFSKLTSDETKEVVKAGLAELTNDDVIEIVVEWCGGDDDLTRELTDEIWKT